MEKIIYLDNIKCGGCAKSVEGEILKTEGITEAKVNTEDGSVTIIYTKYDEESLEQKLSKLGYPPQGTSSTGQKVKSYVSCAIGKMK